MSVCPYKCCDLGNYVSCNTGIRHADSRDSCAHSNVHNPPKTLAPTVLMLEYKF